MVNGYGQELVAIEKDALASFLDRVEEAAEMDDGQAVYDLVQELRADIELSEQAEWSR